MNKAGRLSLRLLGLSRPAPKTLLGLCLRRSERMLFLLLVFYLVLQAFPQIVFAHNLTAGGITVYSRDSLPAEAASCITRAVGLIQRSELAAPDRHERIFVCNSTWLFSLFGPLNSHAFGFSVPWTDNVFIAQADFSRDEARRSAPVYYHRALSGVMAHEITHGLIRHRLGYLRGTRLPPWVAEGYCDYVAGESSFPEAQGLRLLASGQSDPSMSYSYFTYRQMVRYLIEQRRLSFAQVVDRAGEFNAVAAETRLSLQTDIPQ